MDLAHLRNILRPLIIGLKDAGTHEMLPVICERLGLPVPKNDATKAERLSAAFDTLDNDVLPGVAERFLEIHRPAPSMRNKIQDLLWANAAVPEIPKRFRREIAQALAKEELFLNSERFNELLDRLWVLDDDPFDFVFGMGGGSLRAKIERHVYRNPEDWSTEYLFEKLGAFEASHRRFALFLEGLASADVRPDEAAQRRFVGIVNGPLQTCGVEMRETGAEDGYPVFTVVSRRGMPAGRAKNLIFASSVKPDLRFRDAVNNDIEIVTNADKVLVYDRKIGVNGLRWCDLQQWWSESHGILEPEEAKKDLYRRLREGTIPGTQYSIWLFASFGRTRRGSNRGHSALPENQNALFLPPGFIISEAP